MVYSSEEGSVVVLIRVDRFEVEFSIAFASFTGLTGFRVNFVLSVVSRIFEI